MKTHCITFGQKPTGRPPVVDLSPADLREIQSYYLPTNKTKKTGSMLLAWVRFCESRPELAHLVKDHLPTTVIPAAVVEACRQLKAVIGADRGNAKRLRHESAYVPGTMRRHHAAKRRLWAGERASVDDATRNVACWMPWPWGGCPCSDKFGVRLGRWQTLIVHDDASSYIPFVLSVFRFQQSYRATDAAMAIYRTERDVLQYDQWSIEGGVWQSKRNLEILAGRFISAKGRPNQKLVESYIGRLWDIMAGQKGDVGRHRGEIEKNNALYLKCRQGTLDPRQHFMSHTEGNEALYEAITYLGEKRIKSRTYGTWVPKERWEADLLESPREKRNSADDFLIMPVKKTGTVSSDSFRTTEIGPMGVSMIWTFTADWLHQYRGRKVDCYFDPLAEWPVKATICLEGTRKPLGEIECINPLSDDSKDHAIALVKAVRQTVMTEARILSTMHTQRQLRHVAGVAIATTSAPAPEAPKRILDSTGREADMDAIRGSTNWTDRAMEITSTPRGSDERNPFLEITPRGTSAPAPRASREALSNSLARKAARARGEEIDA